MKIVINEGTFAIKHVQRAVILGSLHSRYCKRNAVNVQCTVLTEQSKAKGHH